MISEEEQAGTKLQFSLEVLLVRSVFATLRHGNLKVTTLRLDAQSKTREEGRQDQMSTMLCCQLHEGSLLLRDDACENDDSPSLHLRHVAECDRLWLVRAFALRPQG